MYVYELRSVLDALMCKFRFSFWKTSLISYDWIHMIVGQVLLGVAGFAASFYGYYVKQQHKKNPKYKALCDFGPNASCSRVLTSK